MDDSPGLPFHCLRLLLFVLGDVYWYLVRCGDVRSGDVEVKDFVGGLSIIIVINIVSGQIPMLAIYLLTYMSIMNP